MNLYEKTLAQIEKRNAKKHYRATFKGLTPKGVRKVDRFLLAEDPEFKKAREANKQDLVTAYGHMQREEPLVFDYTFYYEDSAESEQDRITIVKNQALEAMRRGNVTDKLEYLKDFTVTVSRLDNEV